MGFYASYISIVTLYLATFMTTFFAAGVQYRNKNKEGISTVAFGTAMGAITMFFSLYAVNEARAALQWDRTSYKGAAQGAFIIMILVSVALVGVAGWNYGTYHFKYTDESTLNQQECEDLAQIKEKADHWMFYAVVIAVSSMGLILILISLFFTPESAWQEAYEFAKTNWSDASIKYMVDLLSPEKMAMISALIDQKTGKSSSGDQSTVQNWKFDPNTQIYTSPQQ